jgi:antitoxin PrlF
MNPDTVIVSKRGQVALPKWLRQRLGIKAGSALIAEERDGAIMLRPATVTRLRVYTDDEVQGWLREDRVTPAERRRVLKKAGAR